MILSCPACHTRYRLADGAVPPAGRNVRCVKCGNSWHEPGEPVADANDETLPADALTEPSTPAMSDAWPDAPPDDSPHDIAEPLAQVGDPEIPFVQPPVFHPETIPEPAVEHDFDAFAHAPPFQPRARRGRWIVIAILILAAIVGGVAALRLYGPDSVKARLGMTGATPLKLELPRDPERRTLSSGNELFALSGKVVNPSSSSQRVPDIIAELRDRHDKPVYRWTITPPRRTIGPKQSLDFDAAEIDVPPGAHKLALSFSGRAIG